MKKDDLRYKAVKPMLEMGEIKSLSDVFKLVPKTSIAAEMKTKRLNLISKNMGELKLQEMHQLADLFKIDIDDIFKLSLVDFPKAKKEKNR